MLEIQPIRKTDRNLKISPVANMRLAHGNHIHLADARVVPVAHKRVMDSTLRHHHSQPHTTTPRGRCSGITPPWYLSHLWTSLELKTKKTRSRRCQSQKDKGVFLSRALMNIVMACGLVLEQWPGGGHHSSPVFLMGLSILYFSRK